MRDDQPSSTANLIAAATVFLSRDERVSDLVPSGAATWCMRCLEAVSALRVRAVRAVSHPALRWAPRLAELATVPGLLLHFMLRKRWIEEAVRANLADGCNQVVIVGAGFDTLAFRVCADFPSVRFIEIDHPATQKFKRIAFERNGLFGNLHFTAAERTYPSRNLHFIAADLARDRLEDQLLASAAFQPSARAVFIIEGLLMYLTDEEVRGLFTALSEVHRASARIVFTVMEPTTDGRAAFHNATPLVRSLLAHWREPFKSSMRHPDAAPFLDRFGFRLRDYATAEMLRARYLAPTGRQHLALAQGEMIVVGERKTAQ